MCHYTHFITEEREKSRIMKAQGLSVRAIARYLVSSLVYRIQSDLLSINSWKLDGVLLSLFLK